MAGGPPRHLRPATRLAAGLLVATALLLAPGLAGEAQAAPGARWTISSVAAPAYFAPGQEDLYSLQAITVGNAPPLAGDVTVTDRLPDGVTATEATGSLSVAEARASPEEREPCAIEGQNVTCM